jgi:hypothetical protein
MRSRQTNCALHAIAADARTPLRRMKKAADGRALPIDGPDHVVCVTRTSAQRLIATEKWLSLEAVNAGARYGAKHGVRQACRMFKPER